MLGSAAVAVTFSERLFGAFALSIPMFVAASTFGAVNGVLLTSSRSVNINLSFDRNIHSSELFLTKKTVCILFGFIKLIFLYGNWKLKVD